MRTAELIRRLGLGLALAAAAAVALWWSIDRVEARQEPERRPPPARPAGTQVALPPALEAGDARTITLARSDAAVPATAAPVVEIRLGGGMRLLRAAPAPAVPGAAARWDAAVVLPRDDLARLGPLERAALLELLRVLGGGTAVGPDRLRAAGVRCDAEDVEGLLRWQR